MRRFWADVTEPILRQRDVRRVVEIGSQSGESTRRLLELCGELGAHADIIDPLPPENQDALGSLMARHGTLHLARSLDVLGQLPVADAYLIDGDHNWHTVHHELLAIDARVRETESRPPVILMHDVGWPYARRDLYYDPATVPAEARQPFLRAGVHPDRPDADPSGGMNRHLTHAKLEGGPRNGVLTAVEDFLALRPEAYRWWSLPVFHGYGCLVATSELEAPYAQTIARLCTENAPLLSLAAKVERGRVEALIAVEAGRYQQRAERASLEAGFARRELELKAQIKKLEARIQEIEGSRGYQALEQARAVRRRLRRLRPGG
ncbi:MAG: class I SAM-dependent methyltransferase [Deltaproteobacteria bacterium]|nr:class I SAM-dependent methyltransferase [Deltaproteobacteria bacterium]